MIAEVDIPFLEQFKDDMLNDTKVCTSRTELYGTNGDTFNKFGAEFRIVCTVRLPLGIVAEYLYGQEGFLNSRAFINTWIKLHPMKGFAKENKYSLIVSITDERPNLGLMPSRWLIMEEVANGKR